MQPSADAFPGRADRAEPASSPSSRGVPPPRSAPEVESNAPGSERTPGTPSARPAPADAEALPRESGGRDATGPEAPPGDAGAADGLTERERGMLAFERHWWRHAGAKEQAIRDTFGLSATRYYQLLNALLDNPAALAAEPLLVGRLRRLRSSRARNRRR
ncbi:DUF3263 domain-containing protein [Micromonospora sagamiensis]|uniref:Uncharacterized protein DUF3263 n=1 Tax=Micromonospora sagamiensis TaxID=47875 RepID=A0A562W968_9ACTN|nr:DUF3263 domain-containing protein [Micromonospora sagamiensis]TWJ26819.1 uncharacterized protein DUF3263 [Micromonospora sagamiensis]BCL14294.1 hypothetical protein GCM10017556_20330 [Micromonospora sagamiensis]